MSGYSNLRRRLEDREVIILDGAIGTQLQSMGRWVLWNRDWVYPPFAGNVTKAGAIEMINCDSSERS